MEEQNQNILEFDDFRIDPGKRLLFRRDVVVPLMPKAFDTMLCLVNRAGTVVEKDTIFAEVWPDTIVEENNLTQNISALRRAFGEKPGEHRYIVTVPGSGYKFVADVRKFLDPAAESAEANSGRPDHATSERTVTNRRRLWLIALSVLIILGVVSTTLYLLRNRPDDSESIRSIAVLPFRPLTLENRDESLELGMADTLISELGGAEGLTVRPLSAVRRFTTLEQDPVDAGRRLGVQAVLDGSIQIVGERVRVSARLFRVSDSKQVWAGQFDEKLTDIFSVQDSISERVANALKTPLGDKGRNRYTESVEAYQAYMKGSLHHSRLILPEVQKGIAYYEEAIKIDPNYALAYVGIANAQRSLVLTSNASPTQMMPKAKTAALKAIEIDSSLSEAQAVLGSIAFWYEWDWPAAENYLHRALELDSNSSQSHIAYAHFLSNLGRHEEAIVEAKRAREIDPTGPLTNTLEGQILFYAGNDEAAMDVLKKTIEMSPDFWLSYLCMARIYRRKEMYPEMIQAASRARDITQGNAESTAYVAIAHARSGKAEEARRILLELEARSSQRNVPSYDFALIYNALGDRDQALERLKEGFQKKEVQMVFLKIEPQWDGLRGDPRFKDLMKQMNFE
ncbi:MAG TPA: winged helix-turn-helix domain-containing protein [Pyrinomonadaceae bacterium]|nr:winged helix-turn-helix domain-containing protein [Pyrinomonadaceae bacterium]